MNAPTVSPANKAIPEASNPCGKRRASRPVRLALVDDDKSVFGAVNAMAKNENWKVDYYPDADSALEQIPANRPDLVLMDVRMPGMSGIDCTQKLKCLIPALPIVILTTCSDFESILLSLMAGAVGYFVKPVSLEQFKDAVGRVIRGGTALCAEAQQAMLACFHRGFMTSSTCRFSSRERQVMACLLQQLSDKEIAVRLNMETNTVHVHTMHIFRKLGAHNREEAAQKFLRQCIATSCTQCDFPRSDSPR